MTTRQELYESIVEANPEHSYWVRYEDEEGEKHEMPIIAKSEADAREIFEIQTGPRRFDLTEEDLEEMDWSEVKSHVNEHIDGDFEDRTAVRVNPDITVLGARKA